MYKKIIKEAGYKLTRPRQLVLDLLSKKHKPYSPKDIDNKMEGKIDLVSIYRVLHLLLKLGIVYQEKIENKNQYYIADSSHHHIVCRKCGQIECVPCSHLFHNIKSFTKISHEMSLSGVCNSCV